MKVKIRYYPWNAQISHTVGVAEDRAWTGLDPDYFSWSYEQLQWHWSLGWIVLYSTWYTWYTEEDHMYCLAMWASDLMEPDRNSRVLQPVVDEELSLSVTQFNSTVRLKYFPIWFPKIEILTLPSVWVPTICPKWAFVRMDRPKPQNHPTLCLCSSIQFMTSGWRTFPECHPILQQIES